MKLFYSAASPFARKVLACAVSREIVERIERISVNAQENPPALLAANPLGKVPCLVTSDGLALFDSPVICEYLDSIEGTVPMFPRAAGPRLRALKFQAIGDGIMDAAVLRRGESLRPEEAARTQFMERQRAAIARTLDALEQDPPHQHVDIGSIAVACALGYLDFRFAQEPWRPTHPHLAAWFEEFARNPGIAETAPQ